MLSNALAAGRPFEELELKTSLPGCVGQGSDPAVVEEAAAIEDDLGYAGSLRPLSDELPDRLGRVPVAARVAPQILFDGAGRRQCAPADVVDHLGADVFVGPEHRQARTIRSTGDALAHPVMPANTQGLLLLR